MKGLVRLLPILFAIMLAGCSFTKQVPIETIRTVYQDRTKIQHDTVKDTVLLHNIVYQKDSMTINRKGDTVYIERWHTLQTDRLERTSRANVGNAVDSALAVRTDTIRVPYPVERKVSLWEQVRNQTGNIVLALVDIALFIFIIRWLCMKIKQK